MIRSKLMLLVINVSAPLWGVLLNVSTRENSDCSYMWVNGSYLEGRYSSSIYLDTANLNTGDKDYEYNVRGWKKFIIPANPGRDGYPHNTESVLWCTSNNGGKQD